MESSPLSNQALTHRLYWGLAINAVIIVAEFTGGYLINSIGLMSDAGHNLIDQGALFLALYAHVLAAKPATEERTFGYHRAGILAAFVNGFVLLLTAAFLGYLALSRFFSPVDVPGGEYREKYKREKEWEVNRVSALFFVGFLVRGFGG